MRSGAVIFAEPCCARGRQPDACLNVSSLAPNNVSQYIGLPGPPPMMLGESSGARSFRVMTWFEQVSLHPNKLLVHHFSDLDARGSITGCRTYHVHGKGSFANNIARHKISLLVQLWRWHRAILDERSCSDTVLPCRSTFTQARLC